jgi:hypothetical protein
MALVEKSVTEKLPGCKASSEILRRYDIAPGSQQRRIGETGGRSSLSNASLRLDPVVGEFFSQFAIRI